MSGQRILLVGEAVVDVTLQTVSATTKVRLGGVFHAARALWAAEAPYELAYYGPAYLDDEASKMAEAHGAINATKIGDITGCPNIMLIGEPTEAGSQGYEHLLRDHIKFTFDEAEFRRLLEGASDVFILSGNFELAPILSVLSKTQVRVHFDLGNGPTAVSDIYALQRPLSTLFLSTSASAFPSLAAKLPESIQELVGKVAEKIILKENRGGVRLFCATKPPLCVGAQRKDIVHSVGVGDAFDAIYLAFFDKVSSRAALSYASWIAAEYASTTFPDDFKRGVKRILSINAGDIEEFPSVSLPWEDRPACQIYIAAPDFDYVDRSSIDAVADCLRYHNFSPRLPVRENGQANIGMTRADKQKLYDGDVELLNKCSLLIAVNIFNDPGTLIEIGLACAKRIPVLVYDPCAKADNVMLTQAPDLVTHSLDKIITATFDIVARQCKKK